MLENLYMKDPPKDNGIVAIGKAQSNEPDQTFRRHSIGMLFFGNKLQNCETAVAYCHVHAICNVDIISMTMSCPHLA